MPMRGKKMNLAFGLEVIYEDAEFVISDKDKVGIVGVNGAGKTTLFKVLLGQQELDSGSINIGNAEIGYLPQEIVIEDETQTVWDYIRDGRPIRRLENELNEIYVKLETAEGEEQERLIRRMGKIQDRLEYLDVYDSEEILFDLINEVGIDLDLLERPMCELSGGQKSKMAFTRLLFSKSEILLLDEPMTALDPLASAEFYNLLEQLKKDGTTLIIISHDVECAVKYGDKILHLGKDQTFFGLSHEYCHSELGRTMLSKGHHHD